MILKLPPASLTTAVALMTPTSMILTSTSVVVPTTWITSKPVTRETPTTDCIVINDCNRSSFTMVNMLMDSTRQLMQPADYNYLNRICILEKIKDSYNPCRANHRCSLRKHSVHSASDHLDAETGLAMTQYIAQPGKTSNQTTPPLTSRQVADSTRPQAADQAVEMQFASILTI